MDVVMIAATICFLLLAMGFGVVFARLISRDRIVSELDDPDTLFSPARYRAMERLLDETDRKFLASHRCCTPKMEQGFRRVRIKIFRGYMQLLADDFSRIVKAIKFHIIHSEVDRADLAGIVMKEQFRFSVGMMCAEAKLMLYGFGWRGVDATALVHSLDAMRAHLQSLVAVAQPAAS